jgi:hypothetical protein
MAKTKKYTAQLGEVQQNMLAAIMEKTGHEKDAETIRYCIEFTYDKKVKNYREIQLKHIDQMKNKPIKLTKAEEDEAYGRDICAKLGGEVVEGTGGLYCKWKKYDYNGPDRASNEYSIQIQPLGLIGELDIGRQFYMDPKYTKQQAIEGCIIKSKHSME